MPRAKKIVAVETSFVVPAVYAPEGKPVVKPVVVPEPVVKPDVVYAPEGKGDAEEDPFDRMIALLEGEFKERCARSPDYRRRHNERCKHDMRTRYNPDAQRLRSQSEAYKATKRRYYAANKEQLNAKAKVIRDAKRAAKQVAVV